MLVKELVLMPGGYWANPLVPGVVCDAVTTQSLGSTNAGPVGNRVDEGLWLAGQSATAGRRELCY